MLLDRLSAAFSALARPAGLEPATFCSGGKWLRGDKRCVCNRGIRIRSSQANFRPPRFDKDARWRCIAARLVELCRAPAPSSCSARRKAAGWCRSRTESKGNVIGAYLTDHQVYKMQLLPRRPATARKDRSRADPCFGTTRSLRLLASANR